MSQDRNRPDEHELLAQAARGVEERIGEDIEVASPLVRALLTDILRHLFERGYGRAAVYSLLGPKAESGLDIFGNELGKAFEDYLAEARIEVAAEFLATSSLPPDRISSLVGYRYYSSFKRSFARHTQLSPLEFRRKYKSRYLAISRRCSKSESVPNSRELRSCELLTAELHESLEEHIRFEIALSTPDLFEVLSEESRKAGHRNLQLGVVLAQDALSHVETSKFLLGGRFEALHALAFARLGNAQRLAGELALARDCFKNAWECWAKVKHKDRAAEAEILDLEASLRLFQRDIPGALEILDRSLLLAQEAKDFGLEVNAYIQRAEAHRYSSEPEEMLSNLEAASRKIKQDLPEDRRRLLFVRLELVLAYLDTDNLSNAEKMLPKARALAEELNHAPSIYRLTAIEGLICKKKGEYLRAEQLLRMARVDLFEQGDLDSTAIVDLEMAILFHEEGRTNDVRSLVVDEILPTLERLRIHREVLAAVVLLQESINTEITVDVLKQARDALQFALAPICES